MNSFSGWFLSPQFNILLAPSASFGVTSQDEKPEATMEPCENISLHFVLEDELKIVPDNKNIKLLYIHSAHAPKKLSSLEPGRAHIASNLGALFAVQILSYIKEEKPIFITISDELKKLVEGEESDFFLGILQRSVTNKIKKIEYKNKITPLHFNEEFFSKDALHKANSISNAMCITRSLINMPANALNPESFELLIRSVCRHELDKISSSHHIEIDTYDYEKLMNEGCNLICAVGQGSLHKPRIVKLTYTPETPKDKLKHVSLVGKGITFDTGGYDIKSSSGMRSMKKDMGGSAAALGIFFASAMLGLPVKLSCYLAIAENMISGHAMRPGDIYKTRNGLHVEIENTDAEGRLVLADALSLACDEKPDWLLDLATLTGAARVALGPLVDSLYGNNKVTDDLLFSTSIENGDWIWQMPLTPDYDIYLDSSVADFMNASSAGFAGSGTAALFLQKFISVERWSHIDTYMWCDKPNYLWHEGSSPTGKCVRLATRAIEKFIAKEVL